MTAHPSVPATPPAHVMVKPAGPVCNLRCSYCYYLDKADLLGAGDGFRMDAALLQAFVRDYIAMHVARHGGPVVDFAWQGGEPTLIGLDFFREAVRLQQRCLPAGWRCTNALQTNATRLSDEWCAFLREHDFLVGVSIDGPPALHDPYRVDGAGRPTHARVVAGLQRLQAHGVEHNALCVVHRRNAERPLEVYRHLKGLGLRHLQFIPLVEHEGGGRVSPRSVPPKAYGRFLAAIFREWLRHDVGEVFVQTFEEGLRAWLGEPPALCVFRETCGAALVLEHNGDVFACDHFVEPAHRLGNLRETPLAALCDAPAQRAFGSAKRDALPAQCRSCGVRFACHGGCPKDRIRRAANGEGGLNYLCEGYRHFFREAAPHFERMAAAVLAGVPPVEPAPETRPGAAAAGPPGRNGPCPCGSGRKFKRCCGASPVAGQRP